MYNISHYTFFTIILLKTNIILINQILILKLFSSFFSFSGLTLKCSTKFIIE